MHPERHWLTNGDSQLEPIRWRRKVSYDFDPQMFIGCGWSWDGQGMCVKRLGATWCPLGGGVFEGRGQVAKLAQGSAWAETMQLVLHSSSKLIIARLALE